jgi:hypothetical protein
MSIGVDISCAQDVSFRTGGALRLFEKIIKLLSARVLIAFSHSFRRTIFELEIITALIVIIRVAVATVEATAKIRLAKRADVFPSHYFGNINLVFTFVAQCHKQENILMAFCYCKSPPAEGVVRMLIRRRKKALYPNAGINDLGKICKLAAMHFFAGEFRQTLCDPCFLGYTVRDGNNDLIRFFIDFISNDHSPWVKSLRLDETAQSFLLNLKALKDIFGRHAGYFSPDPLIKPLGSLQIDLIRYEEKPESIDGPVMVQQKLEVASHLGGPHSLYGGKINGVCFLHISSNPLLTVFFYLLLAKIINVTGLKLLRTYSVHMRTVQLHRTVCKLSELF